MPGNSGKYQVVFLIDLDTCIPKNESDTSVDAIGTCISLSVLRILTLLSEQADGTNKQSNVRWGFKFFNSVTRRFQKYYLREFTRTDFEKFENEVDIVIESERAKKHGLVKRSIHIHNIAPQAQAQGRHADGDELDTVDQLQVALRDVVSDFQWDQPDITSPVKNAGAKRTRPGAGGRRNASVGCEAHQHNLTFLLSRCPHSSTELARFVGADGNTTTANDVLSSFMPTSLYRQFYENARIRLFWIDLNCDHASENVRDAEDIAGIGIMHEGLVSVGGGVVLLGSIIQLGSYSTVSVQSLDLETREKSFGDECKHIIGPENCDGLSSRLILPHSVLIKTALQDLISDVSLMPSELKAELGVKRGTDRFRTLTSVNIYAMTTKDVHTMTTTESRDGNSHSIGRDLEAVASDEVNSWSFDRLQKEPEPEEPTESPYKFMFTKPDAVSPSKGAKETNKAVTLCIRGTVNFCRVPLQSLESSVVYIVKVDSPASDSIFPQLLSQLTKAQLVLVVTYEYQNNDFMGIIQPMTCDLASLTLVRKDMVLALEKEYSFCEVPGPKRTGLTQFISRQVERLCREKNCPVSPNIDHPVSHVKTKYHIGFESACTERWFTSSVASGTADSLIVSLHDREKDEQIETNEVTALQAMQKLYHEQMYGCPSAKAKSTPRKKSGFLRASPRKGTRTPSKALRRSPRKTPRKSPRKFNRQVGKNMAKRKSAPALSKSRSFTAPLSRTAMIMQKSIQVATQNDDENGDEIEPSVRTTRASKKENSVVHLAEKDFQDEKELVEHLKTYLDKFMDGGMLGITCVQTMVTVVLHYFKSIGSESPEKSAEDFIRRNLMVTTKEIKEKYQGPEDKVDVCLLEYQIQILLNMELESLLMVLGRGEEEQTPTVEEISSMLTRMTLLKDLTYMTTFIKNSLLDNYVETIPKLLGNIYEELLLPLPPQIESLFSGSDDETSDKTSSVQPHSVFSDLGSVSRSPWSPGTRKNMRRSVVSVLNINMGKNRQIAVPAKPKAKQEGGKQKKKEKKSTRPASAKKNKETDGPKSEVKLVRRNLFMGEPAKGKSKLERHQSVPAMGGSSKLKTPKKKPLAKVQKTPKAHHVLKTKKVQETPAHKQGQKVMLRRLENERRRVHTVSEVEIIEESPSKAPSKEFKTSLARRASIGNIRRTSFYSAGAERESRNVQRYEQLEARMTCQNPLTSPTNKTMKKESPPRRIKPVNLFANLNSPSPQKTPRKLLTNSSSAVRSLRDFDMDSPSKNTRTRSLFAPPEIDNPAVTIRGSLLEQRLAPSADALNGHLAKGLETFMSSPRKILKGSSPRRVVLSSPFLSPTKNVFSSPIKSSGLMTHFKTPDKGTSRVTLVPCTPDHQVADSPSTPRRSKRIASPPGACNIESLPSTTLKGTPQKNTPTKRTPNKGTLNQCTPKKTMSQNVTNSPQPSLNTPNKNVTFNIVENWARKALGTTPQRVVPVPMMSPPKAKSPMLSMLSPRKGSCRRSIIDAEPKSLDVRETGAGVTPSNPQTQSSSKVDSLSPRRSRRLIQSPLSHSKSPEGKIDPQVTLTQSPNRDCDTNPLEKPINTVSETSPSRRLKAGRSTPEPTSPIDSWPRKKHVQALDNSPSLKNASVLAHPTLTKLDSVSGDSSMTEKSNTRMSRRKRTFSNTHDNDDSTIGTPSKRRRQVRGMSMLSMKKSSESSLDYFGSPEVFIESGSVVGSTKENSPKEPLDIASPRRRIQSRRLSALTPSRRSLRNQSSGSNSLSNLDHDFSDVIANVNKVLPHLDTNSSDTLDLDLGLASLMPGNQNEQKLCKLSSPSREVSPSTIGRKYSPSISTMSLAHLMHSPLLEESGSPKSGRVSRSRISQGVTSRRSLYKSGTVPTQHE